jgi:hypothetical protein
VTINGDTKILRFYITDLEEDRTIFGYLWLQMFNPKIDWQKGSINAKMVTVKTTYEEPPKWMKILRIHLIGRRIAQKGGIGKDDEVHMVIGKTNVTQQWAETAHKEKDNLMNGSSIPPQYSDFADVFSEKAARRFPPPREDNHIIKFEPDAPDTFSCKIYPISTAETKFLREWVQDNLKKGFIRESKSPFTSPMFLIKKKNGDFQVIQDYRTLNDHTVPDVSSLPLIGDSVNRLHRCTLFTKFDIWWGYHNIRIRKGDQEKATFKTTIGQYEPMVMNFGLRNTLATFQ